jgi:hypothetical protein
MLKAEHSLARVLGIHAAGFVAGIQIALYLYDRYDDGVADPKSLWIGLAMFAAGAAFALSRFRRRSSE